MGRHTQRISDAEAKQLWQRAAELQEAAERDVAKHALPPADDDGRLDLSHVTQAAEGAGINPDFVLVAMAEQMLPEAAGIQPQSRRARWVRRTISETDAIEVRKLIRSSPEAVVAAVKNVAARPSYDLILENTVGDSESLADRVLVYRLQGGNSAFNKSLDFADAKVLLITFRGGSEGTHIRVRAPLFRRGINLSVAGATTALVAGGGTWSGWSLGALAAGTMGLATGAALLIPAAIGAFAGGALGLGGYRALYAAFVRGAYGALNGFVTNVALEAESQAHQLPSE